MAILAHCFGKGLLASYNNLGVLFQQSNRSGEARNCYQKAIAIGEVIYAKNPNNIDIANELVTNYGYLGVLFQQSNRYEEARDCYQKAITIGEVIYAKQPNNMDIANSLAASYGNLGLLLQDSNLLTYAEPLLFRMVELLLKITRATGWPHERLKASMNLYTGLLNEIGYSQDQIVTKIRELAPEFFK